MKEPEAARSVEPPKPFREFANKYPAVVAAYEQFGEAVRKAGPLSAREVALAKLAISIGARMQGSAHAHARKAIAQGIDAARMAGARVINLSLGGSSPGSQLMSAMQRAVGAGIILVISAGNDGEDPVKGTNADPFALVPAQNFPGQVIIAGSVGVADGSGTNLNQLSSFSNQAGQGQNWYLAALGYRVRTIDNTGTGYLYSGTSFSAPIISGAVALMAQAFPNLTAREIVEILFTTADDLGAAGDDPVYGQGRLNIARAFQPIGSPLAI